VKYVRVEDSKGLQLVEGTESTVPTDTLSAEPWAFLGRAQRAMFRRLEGESVRLLDLPTDVSRGSSTGADDVYIVSTTERTGVYLTRKGESVRLEPEILRVPLYATDFGRYHFTPAAGERIIFPYAVDGGSSASMTEKQLKSRFPRAFEYLKARRRDLEARRQFVQWFGYSAPRNLPVHDSAHLLVPLLADRGLFSRFPTGARHYCLMASGGFSIRIGDGADVSSNYLLGLLNSKLLFAYLRSTSNVFRGGWITCTKQYVGPLPIRLIQSSDAAAKGRYDRIVSLVDLMLELNKKKHAGSLAPSELDHVERDIASTDAKIDDLVFELYGISDKERRIVEEETGGRIPDSGRQPATHC